MAFDNTRSQRILEEMQTPRLLAQEDTFYVTWSVISVGFVALAIVLALTN
jgi:hypothetical protein